MPRVTRCLAVLLLISALGLAAQRETSAHAQSIQDDAGLSSYVLAPDGEPVSTGTVVLRSRSRQFTTSIEPTGRFRLRPEGADASELQVIVPGFAVYRVNVTVPPSKTLKLPVIRLAPATYFRVQPVSASGEPIAVSRVVRRSVDITGMPVSDLPGQNPEIAADADGTLTMGPLPRGITALALVTPGLAPTRLPDVYVTGRDPLLDAGKIVVDSGATLQVDIVDATGAPVPAHDVFLEDLRPLSPLSLPPVRTDAAGRATFDHIATGQYRVRTFAAKRCNMRTLAIARVVRVSERGTFLVRIVADGSARIRLTAPFGPRVGAQVTVSPDPFESEPLPGLRIAPESIVQQRLVTGSYVSETSCSGVTDGNGQLVLPNFPPGPARVYVSLPNSRYIARVAIPDDGREVGVSVPEGLLQVLVTNAITKRPVSGSTIAWTSGGARIEARAVASGDALLEGIGPTPGMLLVEATGYDRVQMKLAEPPPTIYEVPLTPVPPSTLEARVIAHSGEPLAHAVVKLTPQNPLDTQQVAVTDATGVVRFVDVPRGSLQLSAAADGFATEAVQLSDDARSGVTLTLSRGYRALVDVQLPSETGPHLMRVLTRTGVAVEDGLDLASDRRIVSPGVASLGPLSPGMYVIELGGRNERRQVRVQIGDRDVSVTIR